MTLRVFVRNASAVPGVDLNVKLSALILSLIQTFCGVSASNAERIDDEPWISERRIIDVRINDDYTYEEIFENSYLVNLHQSVSYMGQSDYVYSSDSESVEILEAYTTLPDGTRIDVSTDQIRTVEEEIDDGVASYSDDKHKIIIFPNVVEGARTYYKVRKVVHTPLYPGHFIDAIYFHPDVYYRNVTVSITYPREMPIRFSTRGSVATAVDQGASTIKRTFVFNQTDLMELAETDVSSQDVSAAIFISTFDSYEAFADLQHRRMKPKSVVNKEISELAHKITNGHSPRREQAREIYNWVSQNIRYVGVYFGDGGVVPYSSEETLENLYGDCKDKSNLLIALLKAIGIEAHNVLINSGAAYTLPDIPVHHPFNHVITYIPEFDLYADPTQEYAPFGTLSEETMGKTVLHVESGLLSKTPHKTPATDRIETSVKLTVAPNGYINGTSDSQFYGVHDPSYRYYYEYPNDDDRSQAARGHLRDFRVTGFGNWSTTELRDLNTPLRVTSTFTLDPMFSMSGPGALQVPVGLSPGMIEWISYFQPEKNHIWPYRCGSDAFVSKYEINFPEFARITHIPRGRDETIGSNTYKSSYVQVDEHTIVVKRELISNRDSMVCPPSEGEKWRRLHEVIRMDVLSQIFINSERDR